MRMYSRALCAGIALLVAAVGCSKPRVQDQFWKAPRPLASSVQALRPAAADGANKSDALLTPADLTLDAAVRLALTSSPALAAAGWDVRAAEAATWQAGMRSNPGIALEVEEILGSGGLSGVDALAASAVLAYDFQMGGKRSRRSEVAETLGTLAAWDYEAVRLDTYAQARQAFLAAVVAQEAVALAEESVALAEKAYDTVVAQVRAGRSAAVEETRAAMAVATADSALSTSRRAVPVAYAALAAQWGAAQPSFEQVVGVLDGLREPPPIALARESLAESPALARWPDEIAALEAAARAAGAEGAPDIGVGVGGQYFRETRERSFLVEVGVPLPLFDTNRGAVAEAEAAVAKGRAEARQASAAAHAALTQVYNDLLSAYHEAVTIRDELVPRAQELLDKTMTGYTAGKFRYPDALLAQEEFAGTQKALLQARANYAAALADVERLIARKLHDSE